MTERFELLQEIGTGGMGTVWRARDAETGEVVALKLLHRQFVSDPEYVARFEREVEMARRIDSPSVVRVLGFGRLDGTPYVAMEYVEGVSLKEAIAQNGRFEWSSAEGQRIALQLTQALVAAHAAGVVHRDLKPSNVLLDGAGNVHLADFGIARATDVTRLTGTMTVLGTPAYMAPDGQATEKSDLYSLGCVLYETFVGAPPFSGETPQQLMLQHLRDAPNLQSLPPDARKPVGWLLEKNPRHRPANATALLAVLQGTSSTPRNAVAGRRPIAVGAVVGLLGLAALGVVASTRLLGGKDGGEDDNPDKGAAVLPGEAAATPTRTPTRGSTTELGVTPPPSTPIKPTGSPSVVATATSPPTPPTATPSPTQPAVPGALVFEEPDGAHPVPGDVVICWDASPLGAEFTITVTRIAPTQGEPVTFNEVVDGDNHCFFGETSAQDVPFVEFRAEARDHSDALVTAKTLRYQTYQSTPAGRPPQITFVSGPASAQLDEPAVFGVFWRDPDGDAATITMTVTDAVFAGTDDPLVESRDISGIPTEEQQSGHETLFGLLCKSVDPEPRTLTFVITDSSGFADERSATFGCTS